MFIAGSFNDVWKYDINEGIWTFLFGNTTFGVPPDFSTPYPGSIEQHAMVYADGALVSFGGYGRGIGSVYSGIYRILFDCRVFK